MVGVESWVIILFSSPDGGVDRGAYVFRAAGGSSGRTSINTPLCDQSTVYGI